MKRALVLSGGGSKGAYQIGVFKALKKLNKKIDIVTGTSIGALNGCLIVQKDYKKALELWNNLSYANVFDKEIDIDSNKIDVFKEYIKAFIEDGGVDISRLESTIKNSVDINKFYKSKIDFGLVTFKLNTLRPVLLTKSEIEKELLSDYLVASATCYPAFKKKKIGNDIYVDGGYYDNLPINLALDMGADEVIAVDLQTIGLNRRVKKRKNIKFISPQNKLGNFLVFDSNEAKRQIKLGYNDTLKAYNKLEGIKYTFSKNTMALLYFFYGKKYLKKSLSKVKPKTKIGKFLKTNLYSNMLDIDKEVQKNNMLEVIEYILYIYNFDETSKYNFLTLNKKIKDKFLKTELVNLTSIDDFIKNMKIKDNDANKQVIRYIYELIKKDNQEELTHIAILLPKEFMAAMYLYTIKKHI
jgi:NTE family protein